MDSMCLRCGIAESQVMGVSVLSIKWKFPREAWKLKQNCSL